MCIFSLVLLLSKYELTCGFIRGSGRHQTIPFGDSSEEVSPCNDFYEYACRGSKDVLPHGASDSTGSDYLNSAKKPVENKLIELLSDNTTQHTTYEKTLTNARKFYVSCLQTRPENATVNVKRLLMSIASFPILQESWSENSFNWIQVAATLRRYGIHAIIRESIGPNWKDAGDVKIYFLSPKFDFVHKEDLLGTSRNSEEYVFFYKRYIKTLMLKLGLRVRKASAVAEQIVSFERALATIVPNEDEIDPPEPISVQELASRIGNIDWKTYLNVIFDRNIDLDSPKIIIHEQYYRELGSLISQTEPSTIAQYLLFKFMFKFKVGVEDPHTPQYCIQEVMNRMSTATGKLYVASNFDADTKQKVAQISSDVKGAFETVLNESSWLDQSTKSAALEKLQSMQTIIGYSDEIFSRDDVSANLTEDYYENCLRLEFETTQNEQDQLFSGLRNWLPSPVDANAFYKITKNTLFLPAALLVPPIIIKDHPNYYNYAVLGSIIGHELTHGFDFEGKNYNAKGSVENWWTTKSLIAYYNHVECVLSQYNNITERLGKVGGFGSISENIADSGGVRLAYKAFILREQENRYSEKTDSGVSVTEAQLFFINFARLWCSSYNGTKLESASHSSNKYRVYNSLAGMPSFITSFYCQFGTAMNPTRKCQLW